jgi:hypothetical protein
MGLIEDILDLGKKLPTGILAAMTVFLIFSLFFYGTGIYDKSLESSRTFSDPSNFGLLMRALIIYGVPLLFIIVLSACAIVIVYRLIKWKEEK